MEQRDLDEGVISKQVFRTAAFATDRLSHTRPVTTPFSIGHHRFLPWEARAAADLTLDAFVRDRSNKLFPRPRGRLPLEML